MKPTARKPTARRCASAVCLLLVNLWTASAWAQDGPPQEPPKLGIVVVEGEGAINNIRDQTIHPPILQVLDENQKPIAGAAVVFFLPTTGPGGTFFDGTRSLTVTTDAQGRVSVRGIRFNHLSGQMKIRVTASYRGQTATAVITQTNLAGPSGSPSLSKTAKVLLIVVLAAGAVTGAVLATRGGSKSGSSTATPPIVITPGTPTVGAP
jgi:hypothetical protein